MNLRQYIDGSTEAGDTPPVCAAAPLPPVSPDTAVFEATRHNIRELPDFTRRAIEGNKRIVRVQFTHWRDSVGASFSERYLKDLTELMLAAAQNVVKHQPPSFGSASAVGGSPRLSLHIAPRPYEMPKPAMKQTPPNRVALPQHYADIEGWFNFEKLYTDAAVHAQDGDVFVEVGAWLGKSTCFLAELLTELGKEVTFYAVDTWEGEHGDESQVSTVKAAGGSIYPQFLDNMKKAGVGDFVRPLRMLSVAAAAQFADASIDFLFIDDDHTEASVRADLAAWFPKVKPGGVIAGHDFDKPGVHSAVSAFFEAQGRDVTRVREEHSENGHWGHCWRVGINGHCRIPGKASPNYGRIFDCFTFYDELDILEARLEELAHLVDVFVICECPYGFRGHKKPMMFLENQERFAKWLPQIRHVSALVPPITIPNEAAEEVWANEGYQRNAIATALDDCGPGDIIMVSDVDEIPHPEAVRRIPRDGNITRLKLDVYHYNFNWLDVNNTWYVQDVRAVSYSHFKTATELRCSPETYQQDHGGWHLTWFGGKEKVAQKVIWYSHPLLGTENTATNGSASPLVLVEGKPLVYTTGLESLPWHIRENLPRYKHFFDPRFVQENEGLFA